MKRRSIIFAAVLLVLSVHCVGASDADRKLIRLNVTGQSRETIRHLLRSHPDITAWNPESATVDILVESEEAVHFKSSGFPVQVVIDDVAAYERTLRQQDYFDHFHTYEQMLEEMEQVAADHPDIARLLDIGDSWEKTRGKADRDIWALKISDNVTADEPDEAEVLYIACHHAREIITPEIILTFMHYLVDGYGRDPEVTFLVDNRQLWLVPMLNPDGHSHVIEKDMWWRKNRRDNDDGSFGVDLNRNYDYMWGYDDVGSSPLTGALNYRGPEPFSEPETRAVRDLVEAHTFVICLSYHSYGNLLLFPWGYTPENTADHEIFTAIADSATVYNGYLSGNNLAGVIYVTNGSTDDWMYGEQDTKYKVFSFTPEVGGAGDGFHPDTSRIIPLIEENLWPNLYVARVAEQYAPRPEIEHLPLADTEDATGSYQVEVRIQSPVSALDAGSPAVHFNSTGHPPFDSTLMHGSGETGLFTGQIPGLGEEVDIYYFFSARDLVPRTGYAPRYAPDSLYSFHVGADDILPVIDHSPPVYRSVHQTPVNIHARVTDNLGVADVKIVYGINSGGLDSVSMVHAENGYYFGLIEVNEPSVGDFIAYRIVAEDRSIRSNMAIEPESGCQYLLLIDSHVFTFEDDDGGFVSEGGSDWEWGLPTTGPGGAYSGENLWGTRLHGPYSDLSDSKLDSPPYSLSGYYGATLSFYHWYRTESSFGRVLDGGNLQISVNDGPFEILHPVGGYDDMILPTEGNPLVGDSAFGGAAGMGDSWRRETFDLSTFADHTVVLRFHFGSNTTASGPGWYIDDVEIRFASSPVPLFRKTTRIEDTVDEMGPYVLYSSVFDDGSIQTVRMHYGEGISVVSDSVDMVEVIPNLYRGEFPGHPQGTTIHYYLEAEDNTGNRATDPPGAPDSTYSFTVRQVTHVEDDEHSASGRPDLFQLYQNYPNPFNPITTIHYTLPGERRTENGERTEYSHATLKVYNILGQEVRSLVSGYQSAGNYTVTWDGRDLSGRELPSGIYMYRFETGSAREVKKMILLK